jgi:hypothetical protein
MCHRSLAMLTASASLAMLLTSVQISLADAIDGDWCKADGKRMKIRGPEIVTPGGNQTRGEYTRHSFSYVVPAGEAGAGENVSIILLSEYLAHARQGSDTAQVQVWNRCPPGVAEKRRARAVETSG